jgi:dCMP deaminase
MRPSFDDYFMSIAYLIASRATCDRKHVGAILVKDKRIIATGYNGSAAGMPHCDETKPPHELKEIEGRLSCVRTLHAESNAIDQAGSDSRYSVLYTTVIPCFDCAKRIVNAGILQVVYAEYYASRSTELVEQYFKDSPTCFLRKWEGELILPQAPEEVLKRTALLQEKR